MRYIVAPRKSPRTVSRRTAAYEFNVSGRHFPRRSETKGSLSFSVRIISTIVILFDRCCNPSRLSVSDPAGSLFHLHARYRFVIRGSLKSTGPRVDSRFGKTRRGCPQRRRGGPLSFAFLFSGTNSIAMSDARFGRFCVRRSHALPAIHGNRPRRDRNIHPRGRETIGGDRCNYSAQRAPFTGGPCSSPGYLPLSRSHSVFSASPPFIPFLPFSFSPIGTAAIYVYLPIPHPSYEVHKSAISFYFSLPPTSIPLYDLLDTQDALPLHSHLSLLRSPSSSFPRICGQFGAAEPPMDREGTRHTAVPTVPSHFEKYPGKMIRPLLRPGLSLYLFLRLALPICPLLGLPLLLRLSFTGADCSSSPVPVPITTAVFSSPRTSVYRRCGDSFSFPETRGALNVIVLSCLHAVSSRGKLAAKRYGRVRHDSL
ncbi:hypothetical protein ALC62_02596 [Cyphomyrmex costatus]|uniref:Uncharacterized protein n=1 Tax=Cyphomyrmex costatus TaxID=456900 RepID=A0A195D0X7_9HYME|nr:hypothetical protein ALC62_02596 [Cyphomyrmex costatus]